MKIANIKQAEAALQPYVPLVARLSGHHTTLDRIQPLMRLLGDPQDRLRVIHIAGTSGKTSTAYYMAALLRAADQHVGLTVSPHVDSITERVQLDGQPMAETAFCAALGEFLDIVEQSGRQPSYFELLYAFSLWVFERQGVDYAVIETGMGGLYDATNVVTRSDKICVITDIGLDHTHVLGKTLPEIATQKIGIAHKDNQVFTYRQADDIMKVFKAWTDQQHASLQVIPDSSQESSAMPAYQQRNWTLAHHVYQYLQRRDELPKLTPEQLQKTKQLIIPGRMEIRQLGNKTLIMDGAHNPQKITTFVESFRRLFPGVKPAIMMALKTGKDYQPVAPLLAPLASRVITTTFLTSQDLPAVSMDPAGLAEAFKAAGVDHVESIPDQQAALQSLVNGPETICLIIGSFYLLSQIRNNELIHD